MYKCIYILSNNNIYRIKKMYIYHLFTLYTCI